MRQTFNYRQKAREFFIVLLPIFITQLALMSTGFFDTVMAGHVSEADLAGVAIGSNLFFPFFGSSMGIISGLTPVVAQLYGAGRRDTIIFVVRQGFYWALGLAALFLLGGYLLVPSILQYLELENRVVQVASGYLMALSCGIVPVFLSSVLRNFIDALGFTRVTMLVTLCIVPVNVLMNYVFIFGWAGVPALGGIGAGVGTAIAFVFNFLLNVLVVRFCAPFSSYRLFACVLRPSLAEWRKQLAVGIPIGCTMFCEQSIFGAVGLLMTVYGTEIVAAHQAAMSFTTVAYTVPMSVSMALTILIGYELGARRLQDAREYRRLGWGLAVLFSMGVASFLVAFRMELAGLYTRGAGLEEVIAAFLVYAIFMQLADGIDAPLQGILRGYKDVRATFGLAVLSYWGIGLPLGWGLAKFGGFGPYGYWIGLITGLLSGAVLLCLRLHKVERSFALRLQTAAIANEGSAQKEK